MDSLFFSVLIVERQRLTAALEAYKKNLIPLHLVTLGRGTASNELMDMLGMDDAQKGVGFSVMTEEKWKAVKKSLVRDLKIDVPGTGIAFTVPLSSVGGKTALRLLTQNMDFTLKEESVLKETKYELIVAFCEQGYSEQVMDAAKLAGAGGGTVIRSKGTGVQSTEKFMGISLANEKDTILIVTRTEKKNAIMTSILKNAGPDSRAKGVCFSLPVTDTAGMRLSDEEEAEESPEE